MPAVACPECQYSNDCDFRFCQRCGYARRTRDQPPSAKLPLVDWDAIEARRQQLLGQRASSQYEKQKSQLEKELFGFLATAPNCRDVMSATPDDVIGFLIWKDRAGKTVVHDADCPGIPGASGCPCPRRLAAGTVDSLIGKLRAVFERSGRAGVWEDKLGMGNPAAAKKVGDYKKAVSEEQARAGRCPKQAVPLFVDKLRNLASLVEEQLKVEGLSAIRYFTLLRDQAFIKILFFAGSRANDLSLTKANSVYKHVGGEFVLLNHTFGKTLRGGESKLVGVKSCNDKLLCPVEGLNRYWTGCGEMGVNLSGGYLFRTTVGDCVSPNPFSAAAAGARLKTYLRQLDEDAGETIHSFRAGAAITLAMSGVELEGVMAHVGWKGRATASHYMQLGKVLRHNSPASVLAKAADEGTAGAVANQYRAWDNTEGFLPVAKTL
ncbi:uncharacterized protein [Branchiostoma lanceolatum]|uniref:uncharacterized protein n=1 Tax=Branchiostoma lanceolatum TaxID=7740 RepID=UPI0034568A15